MGGLIQHFYAPGNPDRPAATISNWRGWKEIKSVSYQDECEVPEKGMEEEEEFKILRWHLWGCSQSHNP